MGTADSSLQGSPARGVEAAGGASAAAPPPGSILDRAIQEAGAAARPERAPFSFEPFLKEPEPGRALKFWLGPAALEGASRRKISLLLSRDIARLDQAISRQVNEIIHHPQFQRLEASWRGLQFLVQEADSEEGEAVKIKVLNVSWKELARDAQRAVEFDQSQLFRKVYNDEFGMPGGEPFGVLLGDYEIRHVPGPDHPTDDLEALASIAQVAAASFSPFIAGADPALFGAEDFCQLERPIDLARIFEQTEYTRWRSFRDQEDARFVGLTLPRVLLRLPYLDDGSREESFRFREQVEGPDRRGYLWGNAAFAFGAVLIRAFQESGWLADIRGVTRGEEGGGIVTGLPVHSFGTDRPGVAPKSSTDLLVNDRMERQLDELGFIPLCHCPDTEYCTFYGTQSVQKPKTYDTLAASMNAKISSMMHYMLCVSRVAHYIKTRTQYKIGSFTEAQDLEDDLNRWIQEYVAPDADAPPAVKARYPLREAQVQVRERPGHPGNYLCTLHLLPHYQLDAVAATVTLKTELGPGRSP